MNKLISLLAISAFAVAANASLMIDSFSDGPYSVSLQSGFDDNVVAAASAVGGYRFTNLNIDSSVYGVDYGDLIVTGNPSASALLIGSDPGVTVSAETGYGNSTGGYLGLNLTALPILSVQFLSSDLGGVLHTEYVDKATLTQYDKFTPFGAGPQTVNVDMSGAGAILGEVDEIYVGYSLPAAGDIAVGSIIANPTPEPAGLLAFGVGVVALFLRRRNS